MTNLVDEQYLLINQVCLEPGQNVPEHQANSNVTLHVVSGEGSFSIGKEKIKAEPRNAWSFWSSRPPIRMSHTRADSLNTGWHNISFRGFADYMQTPEFAVAVMKLVELVSEKTTAIMCAEAVPWRCHRSLIGDALIVRGIDVVDIFTSKSAKPHTITPMAEIYGERVTYPAQVEEGTGVPGK